MAVSKSFWGALLSIALIAPSAHAEEARSSSPRSIRQWAKCGEKVDSGKGVAAAFEAASNGRFTLQIDCAIFIHIGSDIAKPIFIDNGTRVVFTPEGEFIVDNLFIPAFVIANSHDIELLNWRVKFSASAPVDPYADGYLVDGNFVPQPRMKVPQSYAFNDITLKNWIASKRNVVFRNTNPLWTGPVDAAAIIYFRGTASDILVSGMKIYVDKDARVDQFIPTAFSFNPGVKDNLEITRATPITSETHATPSRINFTQIELDGSYMGWQGQVQDTKFEHIRSYRYGDLQEPGGGSVGGVEKWFAPPHLFYLNYDQDRDIKMTTKNIGIADVIDYGQRVGVARDLSADSRSGNALSLKIGGEDIFVDGYRSDRPDGFLDLLTSHRFTLKNAVARDNSEFLHGLYPAVRFPGPVGSVMSSYEDLLIENVKISDEAATRIAPFAPVCLNGNRNLVIRNVELQLGEWLGPIEELKNSARSFCGQDNDVELHYSLIGEDPRQRISLVSKSAR